jgi:hypothetical protein
LFQILENCSSFSTILIKIMQQKFFFLTKKGRKN